MAELTGLKLRYFALGTKGRGQIVRWFLQDTGLPYEYVLQKSEDWPKDKEAILATGKYPFGALPLLETSEGKLIGLTIPIMRYVAKKLGKYLATNDEDQYFVDATLDLADDWHRSITKLIFNATDEMKQKHINEEFPKAAERMNRIYGVHDGPYALGSEITIADFMVYHAIWEERATKKLEAYPNLKKFVEAFEARPNLKDFIASLPEEPGILGN